MSKAAGHQNDELSGPRVRTLFGMQISPRFGNEIAAHVAAVRDAVNIRISPRGNRFAGDPHAAPWMPSGGANAIMMRPDVPKRCGHFEGKDVIPKQEMVSKLKAAVDARVDPDMMILARTDARAVEGFEAALDRARAYQEAGADFLFVEAPLTKEELLAIPREVPGIHLCNMVIGGKTPLLPREELAQAGYAVVCYANAALQASLLAMQQVLAHLHNTGSTLASNLS